MHEWYAPPGETYLWRQLVNQLARAFAGYPHIASGTAFRAGGLDRFALPRAGNGKRL